MMIEATTEVESAPMPLINKECGLPKNSAGSKWDTPLLRFLERFVAEAYRQRRKPHHTLMIYGERNEIQKNELLDQFVPQVTVHSLDCGHWIQQEMPEETIENMLAWLTEGGGLARTNRQSYSRI